MKRIEIAYTTQIFEEIVNRKDVNILQVDVKGVEQNALFQQGFIGIVYYEEIDNSKKEEWIRQEVIEYDWANEGFGDDSIKELLNKGYEKGYNDAIKLLRDMLKVFHDIAEGQYPSTSEEAFIFADIAKKMANDMIF